MAKNGKNRRNVQILDVQTNDETHGIEESHAVQRERELKIRGPGFTVKFAEKVTQWVRRSSRKP